MLLETKPLRVVPKNYVPPGAKRYKVKDGETWETIARDHGFNRSDLVLFNFGTRVCSLHLPIYAGLLEEVTKASLNDLVEDSNAFL